MKTNRMGTGKVSLFRVCCSKGVSYHHSCFGRDSKAGKGVRKCRVKQSEGIRYTLIRGCWPGEAGGGLSGSGAAYVIGWGSRLGSLWLVVSWKWEQKLGKFIY